MTVFSRFSPRRKCRNRAPASPGYGRSLRRVPCAWYSRRPVAGERRVRPTLQGAPGAAHAREGDARGEPRPNMFLQMAVKHTVPDSFFCILSHRRVHVAHIPSISNCLSEYACCFTLREARINVPMLCWILVCMVVASNIFIFCKS